MQGTNKLTDWVIRKIEKEYKDDVALLLAVHGHNVNEDQHGVCFDYYVPATERGNELAETFIIDGIGHDLYPRSWERLENSVSLNDMPIAIDTAEILYARSKEDEERFITNIFFLDGYDELDEFFYIMNYIYFSCEFKSNFLKQKQDVMDASMQVTMQTELPYTSYNKYFKVLLSDEIINLVKDEKINDIKNMFLLLMDDINFDKESSIVLTECFEHLDSFKKRKIDNFERSISSIFNYFKKQMEEFNSLVDDANSNLIFGENDFKRLKRINRLNFLSLDEKEEFYDLIEGITQNNSLIDQVRFLLMIIDMYLEKLPNEGVIEGAKHENRRF